MVRSFRDFSKIFWTPPDRVLSSQNNKILWTFVSFFSSFLICLISCFSSSEWTVTFKCSRRITSRLKYKSPSHSVPSYYCSASHFDPPPPPSSIPFLSILTSFHPHFLPSFFNPSFLSSINPINPPFPLIPHLIYPFSFHPYFLPFSFNPSFLQSINPIHQSTLSIHPLSIYSPFLSSTTPLPSFPTSNHPTIQPSLLPNLFSLPPQSCMSLTWQP